MAREESRLAVPRMLGLLLPEQQEEGQSCAHPLQH